MVEIYLVYGASFVLLGIAALLQPVDSEGLPISKHFWLLGLFGLLHGSKELYDAWVIATGAGGPAIQWGGVSLLAVSFVPLFELGRRAAADRAPAGPWTPLTSGWVYIPVVLTVLLLAGIAADRAMGTAAAVRYVLAFPGAVLAGLMLRRAFPDSKVMAHVLGAAFLAYAVVGALITERVVGYPTWLPTAPAFRDVTDIPIQLFRAACAFAAMLSLSVLVRGEARGSVSRVRESAAKFRDLAESLERRVEERTAALRKSEERLKDFAEVASDCLWETDEEHRFKSFSKEADLVDPNSSRTVIGITRFDRRLAIDHDDEKWRRHRADLDAHRPFKNFEFPIETTDGAVHHIRVGGRPVFSGDGAFIGYRGTGTDITERKNAEAALKRREEEFEALLESAPDAMVISGADGLIVHVNAQAEVLFGYDREELIGKPIEALVPDRLRDRHVEDQRRYNEQPETRHMGGGLELFARKKDGSEIPVEISLSAIRTSERQLAAASVRDITERKKAEQELLAAKAQAEAANRAKSDFLATMSHEIRTPMNGVMGMTDLLLDTPLDERQQRYASIVQTSAQGLLAIINDVLDFSKLEAGKYELETIDFNVVDVIEDVAEFVKPEASEQGPDLATFIAPDVPEFLLGDPGRLRQILLNLAGNAVKFTKAGSIAMTASAAAGEDGEAVLLFEVTDTGIGIAEEVQGKLFEKFSQADSSTTRQYGGTGLGLAICKQLVELMDGEIGVRPGPTGGSTFWFTARFGVSPNRPGQDAEPIKDLSALRVLVVDDVELNRTIFEQQLGSWGIDVVSVPDGEAALKAMRQAIGAGRFFDAAIVDHAMPDMDGEALARRIMDTPEFGPIKLILASSSDLRADLDRLRGIGFQECLSKPVRQSEIFDALVGRPGDAAEGHAEAPSGNQQPAPAADVEAPPTHGLEILVAEDNPTGQLLAKATLEAQGHRVSIVENGVRAVDAVRRSSYDLVVMDINMPEMDGVEATAKIRALGGEKGRIPIIALTANALKGDREKYLAAGMSDYVSKPLDRERLVAAVNAWGTGSHVPVWETPSDPVGADEVS